MKNITFQKGETNWMWNGTDLYISNLYLISMMESRIWETQRKKVLLSKHFPVALAI